MTVSGAFARLCSLFCALFLAASAHAQTEIIAATAASGPCSSLPSQPHFSVKPGSYQSPLSVRLKDGTRGAIIFYTTDGWTPTSNSSRYLGPIAVDVTTTLQAIALVPNCSISRVASATYTLPSAPAALPSAATLPVLPAGQGSFTLLADAQIPLVFSTAIDSRTAQVGDPIAFTLPQDLKIGDTIFAPKGTSATGKVIQVDRSGAGDQPGEIEFQVDSFSVNGNAIPLHATNALSGRYAARTSTDVLAALSTAGIAVLFTRGKDVQIPSGTPLTATIAAGTMLTQSGSPAAGLIPVTP